jgi:hypothetical protein
MEARGIRGPALRSADLEFGREVAQMLLHMGANLDGMLAFNHHG